MHIILANHHFASGKQYDWYSHIRDMGLYRDTVALINHARGWEQPMLARKRIIKDDIKDLWHLVNLRDNSLPETTFAVYAIFRDLDNSIFWSPQPIMYLEKSFCCHHGGGSAACIRIFTVFKTGHSI